MSFTPTLPLTGYAGWRYVSATLEGQMDRLRASPVVARDIAHFRSEIGTVATPGDLVGDYRLLKVALTAFGLQDDIANRAFITRVLSDGVEDAAALSNRLADKRYRDFSAAFGFGTGRAPRTGSPGFAQSIIARFERQSFEQSVGEQDPSMRLALDTARRLPELAAKGQADTTAWLSVLGDPPLRQVFETAFGLPQSIGTLDLDFQVTAFRDAAARIFGKKDLAQFTDPRAVETLIRRFSLQTEIAAGPAPTTRGMAALVLLQSAGRP
jgi:hypothetical protein